jgi:hypothetical protein
VALAIAGAGGFFVEQLYRSESPLAATNLSVKTVFIDEAVQMLGVCKRTIYYRIRQGRLQTVRTHGSQRVLLASIRDYVDSLARTARRPASSEALRGFTS